MKKNKGITLVALIITIIVMLILAGVTITMIIGEDGVVEKAEIAKEKQDYAALEEKIRLQCEYITGGNSSGKVDLAKTENNIRNLNLEQVKDIVSAPNSLTIMFDNGKELKIEGNNNQISKNGYGFYFDIPYICEDFATVIFGEDGSINAVVYEKMRWENNSKINRAKRLK